MAEVTLIRIKDAVEEVMSTTLTVRRPEPFRIFNVISGLRERIGLSTVLSVEELSIVLPRIERYVRRNIAPAHSAKTVPSFMRDLRNKIDCK